MFYCFSLLLCLRLKLLYLSKVEKALHGLEKLGSLLMCLHADVELRSEIGLLVAQRNEETLAIFCLMERLISRGDFLFLEYFKLFLE